MTVPSRQLVVALVGVALHKSVEAAPAPAPTVVRTGHEDNTTQVSTTSSPSMTGCRRKRARTEPAKAGGLNPVKAAGLAAGWAKVESSFVEITTGKAVPTENERVWL